eukprot:SAG11_NODE_3298_length_2539_cov_3.599590_2_plen_636_part_00
MLAVNIQTVTQPTDAAKKMTAIRMVVWGFLWALMCGCVGGAVDIAVLAAFDIDPALKQFIGSMYEEFQADKAALRADLVGERERNIEKDKKIDLLVGQVVGLQAMLHEFSNKTKTRLDQCEANTNPFVQEMNRRRIQEDTLCRGSGLTVMLEACCQSGSFAGNGHRILQLSEGCDALPETCSASCAPLFIEYFEGCQGMLDDLAPDQRQMFVGFYGGCQEVEQAAAVMLEDARPAMIFHVVVMNEAAAQQAQMFGGGSAPAPPIGQIGPIGPVPPSPNPTGGARIAQEFRRVCTTANLTVCVPRCNSLTYGFLLSIEIDGRGTVMTCNMMGLLFSWQGQASLGGYIGDDFQAFFSSVVSGAAGTYILSLTMNSSIRTELLIATGQDVHITGERDSAFPSWASSFRVQEAAHLSLSTVALGQGFIVELGGQATLQNVQIDQVTVSQYTVNENGQVVSQPSGMGHGATQCFQPYRTLNEEWRHLAEGRPHRDHEDNGMNMDWFRFEGAAGDAMLNSPPPYQHTCGGCFLAYMSGTYPVAEDGVAEREACFGDADGCAFEDYYNSCMCRATIQVVHCGIFFLWQLPDGRNCGDGPGVYCGVDSGTFTAGRRQLAGHKSAVQMKNDDSDANGDGDGWGH